MTTKVIFIDDNEEEIRNLIQISIIPLIRELDDGDTIRVNHFAQNIQIAPSSDDSDILDISFCHPANRPSDANGLNQWGTTYDLFMIDLCWSGDDPRNRDGFTFSTILESAGVGKDRITVISNNVIAEPDIRAGIWGNGRVDNCSKGTPEKIAIILFDALSRPSRRSIPETDLINEIVHGSTPSGSAIDFYFHAGKPNPTKEQVLADCTKLSAMQKINLEASCMGEALEGAIEGNDPLSEVKTPALGIVETGGLNALALRLEKRDVLSPIVQIATMLANDWRLKDLLFPEVRHETVRPFCSFVQEAMRKFPKLALVWDNENIPCVAQQSASTDTIRAAVPISWFRVFDDTGIHDDWLSDITKNIVADRENETLRAGFVRTARPYHSCVMFWHPAPGFPDGDTLFKCAGKMLKPAVSFSHIFIGSVCEDGERALVEVLPEGTVRKMPTLKVNFGETRFDFTRLIAGSAYLFAVPGRI